MIPTRFAPGLWQALNQFRWKSVLSTGIQDDSSMFQPFWRFLKYVQFFNSHTLVFHKGIDGAQIIPHLRNELKYSQYSQDWLQMLLVGRGKTSASCAVGTKDGTMSNTSCLIRPGTLQLVCTRVHEHIHWQYSKLFWYSNLLIIFWSLKIF